MGTYDKTEVKENLQLEDVFNLLEYFDAEPEMFSGHIVSYTICHGGNSKKLYYYDNTQLFICYTGNCGTFDIFELVQKVNGLDDLNSAVYFVVNFFNLQSKLTEIMGDEDIFEDWKIFSRYEKNNDLTTEGEFQKIVLPEYGLDIIKHNPKPVILDWQNEGITKEVCDYMGICYDGIDGNILIPHFDYANRVVGIRQRTLVQENEKYGKYRPWRNGGQLFNHPLAFNLYTDSHFYENVEQTKVAVIVESEKSVLQYISYFGTKNNIACAVCGNSISKYQFQLLESLGVQELIIAFDKDFEKVGDENYQEVIKRLENIYQKYGSLINISFLFDKDGSLLNYKDSPLDRGREVFLRLFRERIYL